MEITIRQECKVGVPLLEIFAAGSNSKRPLLIAQHGYLGRKEFILPQAYFLAACGFFVIAPDAWNHGENNPQPPANLFACIRKSALALNDLLDAYREDPRLDSQNAGYVGYSMGGMIAFEYLTGEDVRFKAVCPVIGTPDWEAITAMPEIRRLFAEAGLDKLISWEELLDDAKKSNPVYRDFAPVPLLIQNGAADQVIPVSSVQRFYEKQKEKYTNSSDLQLIIYENQSHADTLEMNQKIAAWFNRYLSIQE